MLQAKALLDQFLNPAALAGDASASHPQQPASPQSGTPQSSGLSLQSLLTGKGGLATGAVAGGLAGLLLGGKKPRKLAASALKVGGIAAVGGLAYKAWSDWQANQAPATAQNAPQPAPIAQTPVLAPPSGTPFMPETVTDQEVLSRSLIRAMISAAKADGHVTDEERQRISEQLSALELDADHRLFIEQELAKPLDIDAVARDARSPEQAAELYTASLLVIDPSGAVEQGYLAMLAARLKLDPTLVQHLHANVGTLVEHEAA